MKRSKKIMLRVIPVLMILMVVLVGNVFAVSVPNDTDLIGSNTAGGITSTAKGIWGTIVVIVQILAVAAVVFAGVRYMFASADQKADIKKSMLTLAIGAVLVFGATTVINLVVGAANAVTTPK